MKRNLRAIFVLFCVLAAASCETARNENSPPSPDQKAASPPAANNPGAANVSDRPVGNEINANAGERSNSIDNADAPANFEGTVGIVDKKYQVKGAALLRDVRTGAHEGFDRVVFEFEGAEMPSYHIEYIDKPVRACGSGDVVPLRGDGWLEIRFSPANAHTEDGAATVKNRAQTPDLKIIKELKSTCDFEAEVAWVLGVSSPNRYRVLELKNPTRFVIDIKH